MITREDILRGAGILRKEQPCLRKGQSIFNYVDMHPEIFGDAARISQFEHGIDCFYRDDMIDKFIDTVIEIYNSELYNKESN